ncbi:MAG: hypothetical protein SCALA702_03580 [Melioribacteraceae bacterium]|nr:MAG: hypothetical protein SCALA702_03580 [Melioribacteraceae bacterium]
MRYSLLILVTLTSFVLFGCEDEKIKNEECVNSKVLAHLGFWIGEWEVYSGNNELEGENEVKFILGDCVIEENWQSVTGHSGKSMFYLDPRYNTLKQVWLTDNPFRPGGVKEKTLVEIKDDKSLVFLGEVYIDSAKSYLDRTILTPVTQNEVKQQISVSINRGEKWTNIFEGVYRRK